VALELKDCWYSYDGRTPALRGVSCSIAPGTWTAIIGQNGSGKSTLAKLCNGLLRPRQGRVRVWGEDMRGRPVGEIARQVGYLFQNPDHQIFAPTVRQEIAFGPDNLGLSASETERRVDDSLALFGLETYAERPPAMLGYGLRRQVTVASLFAISPSILMLDEPTTGLDWGNTRLLLDRLHGLHRDGHTILFITHDMRLVAEHAERALLLHHGQLVAQGATRQIFSRPELLARVSAVPAPVTCLSQELRAWGMEGDSLTVEAFYREYVTLLSGQSGRVGR
jgi:energy-coupling factor transport system ATP-binding protein